MTQEERKRWLAERRTGIGGSDAAAVLGLSPWSTPVNVWLDKTGRSEPKPETAQMRYGTYFEDYVARLYSEETGRAVHRFTKMLHKGCLLGNIDRLVVKDGKKVASHQGAIRTDTLLECKTSGSDWNGEVPAHYYAQVMHYLGLDSGLLHADVAVLYRHSLKFEVFHVERDDEVIAAMFERLTAWWEEFVVGDKMPPPVNEADCKLLWARSNPGKSVEATDDIRAKIAKYADAKATERAAKEIAGEMQSDICAAMGDAEVLLGRDGKPLVTWKSTKDSSKIDWEAVARSLASPEAVEAAVGRFTETKAGARRFILKAAKEVA